MRFLPSLGVLQRKDAAVVRAAGGVWLQPGQPYSVAWDVDRAVKDGLERVIWIFRAVQVISEEAARLPIIATEDPDSDEAVELPPDLHALLNRRTNTYERARHFRHRVSAQLLLSKKGVFIEVVRTNGRRPYAMHLLPPGRVSPVPGGDASDGLVDHFEFAHVNGRKERLEPENVLWIRAPHPTDPYSSMTPLEAAGVSADLDFYARLYNKNFLANDGRPAAVVAVRGNLSPEDAGELKQRFNGRDQVGRVSVIEADGLDYKDLSVGTRDMAYSELSRLTREELLIAFGVSETVVGNASGRTYDNADAEWEVFWRTTMRGHLAIIDGAWDDLGTLTPGFNDDAWVHHDVSSVAVLQRDRQEHEDRLINQLDRGVLTIDEVREELGRDLLDVPGTRALWLPSGRGPVARDETDQETLQPTPAPAPPQQQSSGKAAVLPFGAAPRRRGA